VKVAYESLNFLRGWRIAGLILALASMGASGGQFQTTVEMRDKGASTYYVDGYVKGLGDVELMVDTGSSYLTINEEALTELTRQQEVRFIRELRGVLANGTELLVPVYMLDAINIGGECWLHNVEAAVFPGRTRYILGLSALSRAAPFIFSLDPPTLVLSNCAKQPSSLAATPQPVREQLAATSP
jgi:predicted aspartyl protease